MLSAPRSAAALELSPTHVSNLRTCNWTAPGVANFDRYRTKRLAKFDDFGHRCGIRMARSKKAEIHVCRGDQCVGTGECEHGDTCNGIRQSHQQSAVERVENAVVGRIVGRRQLCDTF